MRRDKQEEEKILSTFHFTINPEEQALISQPRTTEQELQYQVLVKKFAKHLKDLVETTRKADDAE